MKKALLLLSFIIAFGLGACNSISQNEITQTTNSSTAGAEKGTVTPEVFTVPEFTPTENKTVTATPTGFWMSMPAFANNEAIPAEYTCQHENQVGISPEIDWGNLPAGTKSLALIADDPDAPLGLFTHWVVYNIPIEVQSLPQSMPVKAHIVGIGTQGVNGFGQNGYGGPCPPFKMNHRYYFRLYALDLPTALEDNLNADSLRKQLDHHVLGQAEWMGTYHQP
ncbi:MAG: YbhB/YbcL family Raf kinase inhibitor-like protein [Anaerolineae bacterium]|nr:YbhB/YbcL family Raf kinase inhibitor-like protein [Anaerolineae bacterium]